MKGEIFSRFAAWAARQTGRSWSFVAALVLIVVWAASGPFFHFSDTWQLVINTGTTIITFLMVFLIQNTQNRDTMALQLKLDELIRCSRRARDDLVTLEDRPEQQLHEIKAQFVEHAKRLEEQAERIEDKLEDLQEGQGVSAMQGHRVR